MKKIGIWLICSLSAWCVQAKVDQVSVCWEDGLKPPYLMLNEKQQPVGIMVEMVSEILERAQVKAEHRILPWKRCLSDLQSGNIDIVPNSSLKEERKEFALFTKAFYKTNLVLLYNKSEFPTPPKITTVEEIFKYKLGGLLGFNYTYYKEYEAKMDIGAKTHETLIEKLKLGRIQLAIEQKEVIMNLQKGGMINLSGLGMIPEPVQASNSYHVLVGKKHAEAPALVQLLDEGLDKIEKDGTLKKINVNYLGE